VYSVYVALVPTTRCSKKIKDLVALIKRDRKFEPPPAEEKQENGATVFYCPYIFKNDDGQKVGTKCLKPSARKGDYKRHFLIHSEVRPFPCREQKNGRVKCGRYFKDSATRGRHERTHLDTPMHHVSAHEQCSKCRRVDREAGPLSGCGE
jgi:uncharacterized Zn-finger protein